jgi:hypothetical protein
MLFCCCRSLHALLQRATQRWLLNARAFEKMFITFKTMCSINRCGQHERKRPGNTSNNLYCAIFLCGHSRLILVVQSFFCHTGDLSFPQVHGDRLFRIEFSAEVARLRDLSAIRVRSTHPLSLDFKIQGSLHSSSIIGWDIIALFPSLQRSKLLC